MSDYKYNENITDQDLLGFYNSLTAEQKNVWDAWSYSVPHSIVQQGPEYVAAYLRQKQEAAYFSHQMDVANSTGGMYVNAFFDDFSAREQVISYYDLATAAHSYLNQTVIYAMPAHVM